MRKCNSRFDGEYKKYVPLEHRTAVFMFEQRQTCKYVSTPKMQIFVTIEKKAWQSRPAKILSPA